MIRKVKQINGVLKLFTLAQTGMILVTLKQRFDCTSLIRYTKLTPKNLQFFLVILFCGNGGITIMRLLHRAGAELSVEW